MDPFVIYNTDSNYSLLRDELKEAPYSKQLHKLAEATKVR